jgi:hypothetical protein
MIRYRRNDGHHRGPKWKQRTFHIIKKKSLASV